MANEIWRWDATRVAAAIAHREITSREAVGSCLERMAAVNPKLNAVTVDLAETLRRGYKTPFIIKPGDIVFVDRRGIGCWAGMTTVLSVTTDIANLILLAELLKE